MANNKQQKETTKRVVVKKTTVSKVSDNTQTVYKPISSIYETNNYSKFKHILGNRVLDPRNLMVIENSVQRNGYILNPIKVNKDFEIIDGQHRFHVLRKLGMPVHYYVDENAVLKDVQTHNTSVKWSRKDFLRSYVELGSPEYVKFNKFYSDFKDIGFMNCLKLASGTHDVNRKKTYKSTDIVDGVEVKTVKHYRGKAFEEGSFKFKDYEKATVIAKQLNSLTNIFPIKEISFVGAYIRCVNNPNFDFKRFYEQLKIRPVENVNSRRNVDGWVKEVQTIYNYMKRPNQRVMLERI
jgi:hypothetical protein